MKILYLSCHEVLDADECSLLQELGHDVFCPGARVSEQNQGNLGLRPAVKPFSDQDAAMQEWHTFGVPGRDNKENISVTFFKRFDLVIVMHLDNWVSSNWARMKAAGVPVVVRTIGQNIEGNERRLAPFRKQGLKIIRYSPMEENIPGYIGGDTLIRFYKDPDTFKGWNGNSERVICIAQSMIERDFACNFTFFEEVSRPFPRALYGPNNEKAGSWALGKLSFEGLVGAMQDNRVFFCGGTHPASYVLSFIEAWMTGIPILTPGVDKGNASYFPGHVLAEYPSLIQNGINGLSSDSVQEHQDFIRQLMNNHALARSVSDAGRKCAIELFGKETIKNQWADFLNNL